MIQATDNSNQIISYKTIQCERISIIADKRFEVEIVGISTARCHRDTNTFWGLLERCAFSRRGFFYRTPWPSNCIHVSLLAASHPPVLLLLFLVSLGPLSTTPGLPLFPSDIFRKDCGKWCFDSSPRNGQQLTIFLEFIHRVALWSWLCFEATVSPGKEISGKSLNPKVMATFLSFTFSI